MATVQYNAVLFELNDFVYVFLVHKCREFLKTQQFLPYKEYPCTLKFMINTIKCKIFIV